MVSRRSPAYPKPPHAAVPLRRANHGTKRLSMLWVTVFLICGGIGVGATLLLTSLPPLPNCESISPISADMERLYCARERAQSGELDDVLVAIAMVKDWPAKHPLHHEAQELLEVWSESLMVLARRRLESDGVEAGAKIAAYIPATSPVYAEAKAEVDGWRKEWQAGRDRFADAQAALKVQNWGEASYQIAELSKNDYRYWSEEKVAELIQRVTQEKAEWRKVLAARKVARRPQPARLGEAIAQARLVSQSTYAGQVAQNDIRAWSKVLLEVGQKRWQKGDRDGAMEIVQYLAPDPKQSPEAQDFLRFLYAERLAEPALASLRPSVKQLWQLREAIAAIRGVRKESLFYKTAQTNLANWEKHLSDLTQLQYASILAGLGQRQTLQLAAAQSALIAPDRPRRLQAQTLTAEWSRNADRLEHWSVLVQARDLAQPGTVPALQQAIAVASEIPLGHILRIDAQTNIAQWTQQVQILEDQPILDEAQRLARSGEWRNAIQIASRIAEGRALHRSARREIAEWRAEIRQAEIAARLAEQRADEDEADDSAEPSATLDEAIALASRTRLSRAIALASQIDRGDPQYRQARRLIRQWKAEREEIWQNWAEEGRGPYADR